MNRQITLSKTNRLEIISTLCFIIFLIFSPTWINYFLQGGQNLKNIDDVYITTSNFIPGSIIFLSTLLLFLFLKFTKWIYIIKNSSTEMQKKFILKSFLGITMVLLIMSITAELSDVYINTYINNLITEENNFHTISQSSFILYFICFSSIYLIDTASWINKKPHESQKFNFKISYLLFIEIIFLTSIIILTNTYLSTIENTWITYAQKENTLPWFIAYMDLHLPYVIIPLIGIMLCMLNTFTLLFIPLFYFFLPSLKDLLFLKKIIKLYLYKLLILFSISIISLLIIVLIFLQLIYSPDIITLKNCQIVFPILAIPYAITYLYYGLTILMIVYIVIQMYKRKNDLNSL